MLIDRRNFKAHRPWLALAVVGSIAAVGWYLTASRAVPNWPGGSSPPGLTFGIVGGALIVFECLLWPRKKLRAWRVGRVQTWMAAHIWLGLMTVPLLVLHSGFRWGGTLSAGLMVVFLVVIASGVWGLTLQQILPRLMLNQVPAETIHSQIGRMVRFLSDDAYRLVLATCGPAEGEESREVPIGQVESGAPISHLTVGAVQTVGDVQGKVLLTRGPQAAVPGSEPLRALFRSSIGPYLARGRASRSPLASPTKAGAIFDDLRSRLGPATRETVDLLENFCDQRRQLDRQARLHRWLHNWLAVHLPLSVALLVLMAAHAWVALKYR